MPEDAPPNKLAATRGYGAEVIPFDRYASDREQLLADARGRARGRSRSIPTTTRA